MRGRRAAELIVAPALGEISEARCMKARRIVHGLCPFTQLRLLPSIIIAAIFCQRINASSKISPQMPDNHTFPGDFPEGCPPASAVAAQGEVFRLVLGAYFQADSFATYLELGKAPHVPPCKRASISVFNNFRGACHLAKIKPRLGDHVATGVLTADAGKMSTPSTSGHIDWWPYKGVDRQSFFTEPVPCL